MASQAYYDWLKDGQPWKFATPIADLRDILRAHGYTVYDRGNLSHLTKDTPEDHTPFSATGWPAKSPYPYCMAGDIMPPTAGARSKINGQPLPSLQKLASRMRADKMAGHPDMAWLKYMNWEPEGNNTGPCYHDSWTPSYARRLSTDRGHIHMSGRTDYYLSNVARDYDPVALILEGDDMSFEADQVPVKYGYVSTSNPDWTGPNALGDARDKAHETRDLVKTLAASVASNEKADAVRDAQIAAVLAGMNTVLQTMASATGVLNAQQVEEVKAELREAASAAGAEATATLAAKLDSLREHLGDAVA